MSIKHIICCDQCQKELSIENDKIIGIEIEQTLVLREQYYLTAQKAGTTQKQYVFSDTHFCCKICAQESFRRWFETI